MPQGHPLRELIRFVRDLQKPFAAFGLMMPGARGGKLRSLAKLEAALEHIQENQETWERIAQATNVLVKNVRATKQIMADIEQTTGQHLYQLGELDDGIQERLKEALSMQEATRRVASREDRATERERHIEDLSSQLNQQLIDAASLEQAVKDRLEDVAAMLAQIQALERDVSTRQSEISRDEASLHERKENLDQVKLHIQSREEAVRRSTNQLADLAQKKQDLQLELASLRKQCQEELERGDELLRERELTLVDREKEVGALGMSLAMRERALHERQQGVERRESDADKQAETLDKLSENLKAKERHAAELQATIEALMEQRDKLNETIAGLSARL